MKFIDLFAGMGGIRLGFEEALKEKGLTSKTVFVSEIKKSAIKYIRIILGIVLLLEILLK